MKFALSVPDFRRTCKGNIQHKLSDIIVLMVLGRASKCVSRADIIEFGRQNLNKFRSMGMFLNGVPSEPTLCRVEQGIDDNDLAARLSDFSASFLRKLHGHDSSTQVICVDGKAMRGTVQSNGRNPDIVSAYSCGTGMTLATEACQEKSNEITAVPILLERLDLSGHVVTADAMSMQKRIIDTIREKGGEFIIELKANQRSLRYGIEDRIGRLAPMEIHTEGPVLDHGRIETRIYRKYDGMQLVVDRDKWGSGLTVIEFESETIKKSTGATTCEKRLYISSLDASAATLGALIRRHWSIESMHWTLDRNFLQDKIKRKSARAARNLDTIQRVVHAMFSIWKSMRRKRSDKAKGIAEMMRSMSHNFAKLLRFMNQK